METLEKWDPSYERGEPEDRGSRLKVATEGLLASLNSFIQAMFTFAEIILSSFLGNNYFPKSLKVLRI